MCRPAPLLSLAVLASCYAREASAAPSAEGAVRDEVVVDMVRTRSGLEYIDLRRGAGRRAKAGDVVEVHYVGRLAGGKQFDSSRAKGRTAFRFKLGAGQVIKGWDEGVAGMRVGGKRRLVLPPRLGYGARGVGGIIPPNATLTFEVELLRLP